MPTLSARKKAAVMDAAVELFQLNGFQGTSMDAIAARAQVSKRTVYNHFPSKHDLFETIAMSVWQKANQVSDVVYDPALPARDQLIELVLKELDLVSDEGFLKLSRILAAEFIHKPDMAQQILARFDKEQSSLTLWMQKAAEHAELNISDAAEAGTQFHALIKAQAFWPQIMFGQEPISKDDYEEFADKVCTMFLALYGGEH